MIHTTCSNKTIPPTLKTNHSPSPPRIFVLPQPTIVIHHEASPSPQTTPSPPHTECRDGTFQPQTPEQPPKVRVSINILKQTQQRFGKRRSFPTKSTEVSAVTDSRCQTCTVGPEILQTLNCPTSYLIKTRHNIVGITNSPLNIIGVLFLQIGIGHKTTNQMVYISKNCRGFFLSQTAMKDLDVVPEDFPNHTHVSAAIFEHIKCNCPKRTKSNKPSFYSNPSQSTRPEEMAARKV